MIHDLHQLVREIADVTGAGAPALLEADAPILTESTLREDGAGMYLVGLIGGKDVGKSALVNALVGHEITARTSSGPGTEIVIAYAHQIQAEPLRQLLERHVPGQFRIVTHAISHLARQVLIDLPDIDSHYAAHVELTRRMLKHMLFPIWIQSIEKYADQRPRELLAMVAAGNAPQNFIFCLNKVDQIIAREGEAAARELQHDYARRLAELLKLKEPPQVWMISAIHPGRYDLPALRDVLAQQKSEESVVSSRQRAIRRQGITLADWIDRQDLPQRLAAMDRLQSTAEEELASRVVGPLVDQAVPALLDDPAYGLAMADELMQKRVRRWPIVNILHVLLGPLLSVARRRLPLPQQRGLEGAHELVDLHLHGLGRALAGASAQAGLAGVLQSTFAFLQQSSPMISRLYAQQKLWEPMAAELAEADLRRRMAATIEQQRDVMRRRLGSGGLLGWMLRVLLTIGAVLWFPFAQPLLEAYLQGTRELAVRAVALFGVDYLLKNVVFLAIYFVALWLILKWDTQRRVDRWLTQWRTGARLEPTLNLSGQVLEWAQGLLHPLRAARARLADLAHRADELRQTVSSSEAA